MREHPVKIGFVAVGVTTVVAASLYLAYLNIAGPVAPTSAGGDATGIIAVVIQIVGVVTTVLGFVADFKKVVPPEVIAAVRRMWDKKQFDVVEVIAIASGKYGKVDMNALFDLIKRMQGELGPLITPKDLDVVADATRPANVVRAASDEDITRQIMESCTRYKQRPVLVRIEVGSNPVVDLKIASVEPTA